jgi:hypothetical protein
MRLRALFSFHALILQFIISTAWNYDLAKIFVLSVLAQKCPPLMLVFSIGMLSCVTAKAELDLTKVWMNAGFYSAHFDTHQGLRNSNPGLGVEYPLDETWSLTAGRFINSDNLRSNYLGAYYRAWHLGDFKLGVVGGAFNGYPKAFNGGWFPAVLPVASFESGNIGMNVMFVPSLKDRLHGAVSFQLKYRFEK